MINLFERSKRVGRSYLFYVCYMYVRGHENGGTEIDLGDDVILYCLWETFGILCI